MELIAQLAGDHPEASGSRSGSWPKPGSARPAPSVAAGSNGGVRPRGVRDLRQ
jgi:hypothetical protein